MSNPSESVHNEEVICSMQRLLEQLDPKSQTPQLIIFLKTPQLSVPETIPQSFPILKQKSESDSGVHEEETHCPVT